MRGRVRAIACAAVVGALTLLVVAFVERDEFERHYRLWRIAQVDEVGELLVAYADRFGGADAKFLDLICVQPEELRVAFTPSARVVQVAAGAQVMTVTARLENLSKRRLILVSPWENLFSIALLENGEQGSLDFEAQAGSRVFLAQALVLEPGKALQLHKPIPTHAVALPAQVRLSVHVPSGVESDSSDAEVEYTYSELARQDFRVEAGR
jgi:hypothetical protein